MHKIPEVALNCKKIIQEDKQNAYKIYVNWVCNTHSSNTPTLKPLLILKQNNIKNRKEMSAWLLIEKHTRVSDALEGLVMK